MKIEELITEIHKYMDQLDFVTARRLIEGNIDILKKHKYSLKGNARELLKIICERIESGVEPIARNEMATIRAINSYATKFDLISLKSVVKNNPKIFLRKDINQYLNKDAQAILEGMGVITKQ